MIDFKTQKMAKQDPPLKYNGIGNDAVKAKTGKGWDEWIKLLDKEKASKLSHKEIAIILSEKYNVGDWWSQMVTVGYEKAKGLRETNQSKTGYEISVSKVFPVAVDRLFLMWDDEKRRNKWLKEKIVAHKSIPEKSMRFTWKDGSKSISVNFSPKGAAKSQVTVQHGKLKDAKLGKEMKGFWQEAIKKLEGILDKAGVKGL
jgi:uncharacterized protein YndB with AHSA1/START domain